MTPNEQHLAAAREWLRHRYTEGIRADKQIDDLAALLASTYRRGFEDARERADADAYQRGWDDCERGVHEKDNPAYHPGFGDERLCQCGHDYYRHFDTYDHMRPIGCKYCPCSVWHEPSALTPDET